MLQRYQDKKFEFDKSNPFLSLLNLELKWSKK